MKKTRKLIDIDNDILKVLESEAKKQRRSLKSFLEYTIENTGRQLDSPSAEYKAMMDDMLNRLKTGDVHLNPIEEIEKRYGL